MQTNFVVESLTPRQREVLALMDDGYSNREIAEKLGITLDGAKWHVSEILGKFGVDSRDEAVAAWRSLNSPRRRLVRFGRQIAHALSWRWLAAGGAAVGAVAVAAAVALIVQQGGNDVPAAASTPGPTAVVKASSPAPQRMLELQGAPPRENTVMYVATGCWGCEGNDTGLRRIVTGTGTPSVESVTVTGLHTAEAVTWYTASGDGSLLLTIVCAGGNCGPMGQTKGDEHSRLLGSSDGGYSWMELASRDGLVSAVVGPGNRVLLQGTNGSGSTWSLLNPAGTADRPATVPAEARPQFMADGTVGWFDRATATLFRSDGSLYFRRTLSSPDTAIEGIWNIGTIVLVKWFEGGGTRNMIGLFDLNGATLESYEIAPHTGEMDINPADTRLINVTLGMAGSSFPALMQVWSGVFYPFYDPFGVTLPGRNRFLAYVTGPFLRVNGAGDCLNVRAAPAADAATVGCYRDGVLFVEKAQIQEDGTTAWRSVRTPDGHDGWASARYLAPLP